MTYGGNYDDYPAVIVASGQYSQMVSYVTTAPWQHSY